MKKKHYKKIVSLCTEENAAFEDRGRWEMDGTGAELGPW